MLNFLFSPFHSLGREGAMCFFPHSFDFVFFLITNRTENSLLSWKKEWNISEFFHFLINKHVSEFAMMDRTHERITWAQQKQSFMYFDLVFFLKFVSTLNNSFFNDVLLFCWFKKKNFIYFFQIYLLTFLWIYIHVCMCVYTFMFHK